MQGAGWWVAPEGLLRLWVLRLPAESDLVGTILQSPHVCLLFRVYDSGFRGCDVVFRVSGLGLKVEGFGCIVEGLWFRVYGLGFEV